MQMTPEEHLKSIGRDGSYIEVDATGLVSASLENAKMIVLRALRVELSDPAEVEGLRRAIAAAKAEPSLSGLSEEQLSFYVFRQILKKGLAHTAQFNGASVPPAGGMEPAR